jgi:transcriptional regulator with XRE-family HTH domain
MSHELETGGAGSAVANQVRGARRRAGLTQKELGKELGVGSITVSRWERGVTTPSLVRLKGLAEVTGTPLEDLVPPGEAGAPHAAELAALREELAELRRLVDRMVRALDGLTRAPVGARL